MITEWMVKLAVAFAAWVAGLFPSWGLENLNFVGVFSTLGGLVSSLGVWIPWEVLGICAVVVLGAWVVVVGIKLVRALMAHVPGIGGSGD